MIRRPAPKLEGTGHGALRTRPVSPVGGRRPLSLKACGVSATPWVVGWERLRAGGATCTRGSLYVHARMHALLNMRSCASTERGRLFGRVEAVRARDPTSRPKTRRHGAGRTLYPARRPLPPLPCLLSSWHVPGRTPPGWSRSRRPRLPE